MAANAGLPGDTDLVSGWKSHLLFPLWHTRKRAALPGGGRRRPSESADPAGHMDGPPDLLARRALSRVLGLQPQGREATSGSWIWPRRRLKSPPARFSTLPASSFARLCPRTANASRTLRTKRAVPRSIRGASPEARGKCESRVTRRSPLPHGAARTHRGPELVPRDRAARRGRRSEALTAAAGLCLDLGETWCLDLLRKNPRFQKLVAGGT
jgi:hypothetical protein